MICRHFHYFHVKFSSNLVNVNKEEQKLNSIQICERKSMYFQNNSFYDQFKDGFVMKLKISQINLICIYL